MYKNTFYPLRSIVGPSVPVKRILPTFKPPQHYKIVATPNDPVFPAQTLAEKADLGIPGQYLPNEIYTHFLPDILKDTKTYLPLPGMATMPIPDSAGLADFFPPGLGFLNPIPNFPFPADAEVASIFGFKTAAFQNITINTISPGGPLNSNHPFLSNRDREYSFLISLEEEALIGGICFSGYPYITSRIESGPEGMTLGNFGLPREIRLTPLPARKTGDPDTVNDYNSFQRSQFIDSEFAYTRQEIVSHSGLNYLHIDPVKTNMFVLTITDLPFIINHIDLDSLTQEATGNIATKVNGFKGFAIPYLYFFEYKETTSKHARLHSGVLGVRSEATPLNEDGTPDAFAMAFPEYEFNLELRDGTENYYALFTAHSALGQKRKFPIFSSFTYPPEAQMLPVARREKDIEEMFVSDILQPDERVIIYLQQGEEFDRCIAGLKMLIPMISDDNRTEKFTERALELLGSLTANGELSPDERNLAEDLLAYMLGLPPEVDFCEQIRIRIFELDPPEGVSPTSLDLNSKYATMVANVAIDDFFDVLFAHFVKGIAFKRISASRYFAIELTNTGEQPGQIVIHSMHLVRSAHVSVQPRAARTQQVKALHYRIIGPELADDFSRLGTEGFNFCIDRVVAGQTKNVLYSAMSLLDLLHTGGARIQSNMRRRAVEFEMTENYIEKKSPQDYQVKKFDHDDFTGRNFEKRETDNDSTSWRSIESGKDISWPLDKGIPDFEFESFSGNEIRTRTEQVSSLLDPLATSANNLQDLLQAQLQNLVSTLIPINNSLINISTASNIIFRNQTSSGFGTIWKPFQKFGLNTSSLPPIQGFQTLNIPPHFLTIMDSLSNLLNLPSTIAANGLDPAQAMMIRTQMIDDLITKLTLVNGLSLGFNVGANAGVNGSIGVDIINVGLSVGTSGGVSVSANSNLTSALRTSTNGSVGSVVMSGQELKYSLNRNKQIGYDNNLSDSELKASEQKRIVTRREMLDKDTERVRGAEVMWQGKIQDIITGSIPLNFTLPATATKMNFRTADDSLRVRFNSGFSSSVEVDFWFELTEETIRDDN